jgi:hypothetical protein
MELPSQQRKVPKEEKEIKQAQVLFPAPVETCKAKEIFVAKKASGLAWKIATSSFWLFAFSGSLSSSGNL